LGGGRNLRGLFVLIARAVKLVPDRNNVVFANRITTYLAEGGMRGRGGEG
jgi:hypothetical protein